MSESPNLTKSPIPTYNRAHPDNFRHSAIGVAASNRALLSDSFFAYKMEGQMLRTPLRLVMVAAALLLV
ncbi:MAG: hypothetical protein ABIV47_05830, partial [Roseiflexaceae bacterium]